MLKKTFSAAGSLTLPLGAFVAALASTSLLVFRTPDDPTVIGAFFFLCALVAGLLTSSLSQLILRRGTPALGILQGAVLGLPVGVYVLMLLVLQATRLLGPLMTVFGLAIVVLTEYVIWPRAAK